jgi:hypothetical protein
VKNPLLVAFTDRAGAPWLPPDGVRFAVDSLAKSAALPYKRASITASGPREAVFELLETLRYGVKIYAKDDPAVWLGYVSAVLVNDRGNLVGLDLDDMANRVAVRYSYVAPGTDTVGTRADTAWADDAASQGEFGVKELWLSRAGMTAAAAAQLRDTYLATHALPSPPPASYNGMGAAEVTATLQCKGWLYTLDWTYYANAATADTATSTQIAAILAAGEFITSVTVETASGISTSAYRKGDLTALEELLLLLEMGTTNGRQYQVEIDEARNVRVVEAPADTEIAYRRRSDGQILSLADELVNGYRVQAGRWVELKDSIPQTVDTTWMRAVGKFLIDELEYLPGRGLALDAAEASVKPAAANGRMAAGDVGRTIIGRGAPYRSPHALTPKGAATAKPMSLPEIQAAVQGEPFDYSASSTITGWASFTAKEIIVSKSGRLVHVAFYLAGTSNSASTSFTLPFAAAAKPAAIDTIVRGVNNGAYNPTTLLSMAAGGSAVGFYTAISGGAWTASGTKWIRGQFWYYV